jgi:uncharacterized protein
MSKDEIIAVLRARQADLTRLGVASLRLFGSHSRDAAAPGRDIDFVVAFHGPATFDGFMDLRHFLEDLLGRRVDLVTEAAVRPELRPSIEREAIRVA